MLLDEQGGIMRKIFLLAGLVVIIGVVLSGCMKQMLEPQEEGGISITIPPRSSNHMMSIGPKMIPANAEFIRVRICRGLPDNSKFNRVVTIPLLPEGSTTDISLLVGSGYMIAAISYLESDGENYALTYDSQQNVSILPGVATPVTLDLQPWTYTITGDEIISSEGEYRLQVYAELEFGNPVDMIGDVTRIAGSMYTSLESFQAPSTPFPDDSTRSPSYTVKEWVFSGNTAPTLAYTDDAATPLYVAFLFSPDLDEWSEEGNPSKLTLCIPNRYLGESLHQIIVTPPPPPEGDLDLVIQ